LAAFYRARFPQIHGLSKSGRTPNPRAENIDIHREGRAVDLMILEADRAVGEQIANELAANAGRWGIQYITYWRGQVGNGRASRRTSGSPHLDHVHVELTREASQSLTEAALAATFGQAPPPNAGETGEDYATMDEEVHNYEDYDGGKGELVALAKGNPAVTIAAVAATGIGLYLLYTVLSKR